jgi:putative DNA primase/helicase
VGEVVSALPACGTLVSQPAPHWIGEPDRDVSALVPCKNVIVNARNRATCPLTPQFFATWGLPFNYDLNAPQPQAWLRFLDDVWGDDPDCRSTVQEMFGLFLSGDLRHQKIFLMPGPTRSGKGTIARVLLGLLGRSNVAGPTLAGLATNFGLQSLLGKPLAIVGDARISNKTDQAIVVERLLSISGQDAVTVDRKGIEAITVTLPTRILIITNELPRLNDASGALANRFIVLRMTKSFLGREDHSLTDTLLSELPGILNWAIDGAERLAERGHFLQPESGMEALGELETLGSPVTAFLSDQFGIDGKRFVCDPAKTIRVDDLFTLWREWCEANGRDNPSNKQIFGRDLQAAFPGITVKQERANGNRIRIYSGVGS